MLNFLITMLLTAQTAFNTNDKAKGTSIRHFANQAQNKLGTSQEKTKRVETSRTQTFQVESSQITSNTVVDHA